MTDTEIVGEVENVPYESRHFEWRIPDIFALLESRKVYYLSPTFPTTDASWEIAMYLFNNSEIKMYIRSIVKREYSQVVCFGLKGHDGTVKVLVSGIVKVHAERCPWKFIMKKEELIQRKIELAPSDILTVVCTIKWTTEISHSTEPTVLDKGSLKKLIRLEKLSANFKDLYANKETCDVILKVQDQEFLAHCLILIASSSVFAANFKHDTLEKQTGVITIPDCDPESFQQLLEYLYTGELAELAELSSVVNLYYTSNKYDIEEVKTFCIEYLMQCLSIETVCEIAEFADKYDEAQLFSQAQDFFNKNSVKILLTSGWECLIKKDCRLANKLLTDMAKMKLEKSLPIC